MASRPRFKLTADNYHSMEANRLYMSSTQIKTFLSCEARAMAELSGEYVRETTTSLLVGSYVDAYFSGEMNKFMESHPELYKRDGGLKADYVQANQIIARIEADPLFMQHMQGRKQVIKTGKIGGIPFKIKMDNYMPKTAIVDLKIVKDFKPVYKPEEGRLSFVEAWQYDLQGAIYQTVEGHSLPFILAAATKEKVTDIALIQIPQHYLDASMALLLNELPHIVEVKAGRIAPKRCEKCNFCRATKKLTSVIMLDDMFELDYDGGEIDQ